ncbi:hypothetical protein FACS189474_1100 [Bacteroidia bacterium]|nr:hypothetical protein FACS189474_1100 [Bacteroidia bacterium]
MNLKYFIFTVSVILLYCSCGKNNKIQSPVASYDYSLVKSDKKLTYNIDGNVEYDCRALFPFQSKKDGSKYLTFQNRSQSEILFYKMDSMDCFFRLKIEREGPDGVPGFLGYHIKDFDEIYLTSYGIPIIVRTDTTGRVLQKINYGETDEGKMLLPFTSTTTPYTPLTIIGNKFFFTQDPDPREEIETWPVSGYVDTLAHSVQALPLTFPPIIKKEEIYTDGIGPEFSFSRCFNGSEFVYSFLFEENIVVTSQDHQQIKRIPAKSKYISKINDAHEKRPADMVLGAKRMCEAPFYGYLFHDSYRKVYYRIAYPETEMEANENYIELWTSGRKRFSIVILDEHFNIIGETLFPDYTYKSKMLFVGEEGLYICDSHVKNPEFNEDILSFQCFELSKK